MKALLIETSISEYICRQEGESAHQEIATNTIVGDMCS